MKRVNKRFGRKWHFYVKTFYPEGIISQLQQESNCSGRFYVARSPEGWNAWQVKIEKEEDLIYLLMKYQ